VSDDRCFAAVFSASGDGDTDNLALGGVSFPG
jgi:hypothetical protein